MSNGLTQILMSKHIYCYYVLPKRYFVILGSLKVLFNKCWYRLSHDFNVDTNYFDANVEYNGWNE